MNSVAPFEEAFVVTRTLLFTLALATMLGATAASAQQRQITGRVTSTVGGDPIAGVAVSITGTALAVSTNAEGRYAIAAPAGPLTLVFRRIAFKRREVQVAADQNTADATLEPDVFNLEAVVVTGQATGVERRNAAIATSVISGSEVTSVPAPAVDRALQGRVPGAYIQQNSGAPGGGTQSQIRGSNTVVASADPLVVGDGAADAAAKDLIRSYRVNGQLPSYDHLREVAGEKPINYETQLDVSGGAGETRYFLSGNLKGDGGIIANTGAQRQSLRANLDQAFSNRFSVAFSSAFNHTTTQRGFTNNDNNGASTTYALAYIPGFINIEPVNGAFPKPGITYLSSNPLQNIALGKNDETAIRFTSGLTATYQAVSSATHSLKVIGAGGIDFFNQSNQVFAPPELYFEANQTNPGVSTLADADSRFLNWNFNAIDTYSPSSGSFKATTS